MAIDVLRFHWSLHPDKDLEWYNEQCERRSEDEIAKELDIKYIVSTAGVIFRNAFKYNRDVETGLFERYVHPRKEIYVIADFGQYPACLFIWKDDGISYVIDELVPEDRPNTHTFCRRINDHCDKHFKEYKFIDICDIAGKQQRHSTESEKHAKSDADIMCSIRGRYPIHNKVPILAGIELIKACFAARELVIDPKCRVLLSAIQGGYTWNRKDGEEKDALPREVHPYEDVMDCLRYYVWETHQVTKERNDKSKKKYYQPSMYKRRSR